MTAVVLPLAAGLKLPAPEDNLLVEVEAALTWALSMLPCAQQALHQQSDSSKLPWVGDRSLL